MIGILLEIDAILCILCIFALFIFCALIPTTNIAKYFYILFGITLLPIGIKSVFEGEAWYEYIWFFLFAIVGIGVGIILMILNKNMTKEEQEKFDYNFGKMARNGGKRKVFKHLWKIDK